MFIQEKIDKALQSINPEYIAHYSVDSWGSSILLMKKDGNAFGRIYWYNDDDKTVYLDFLSVDDHARKNGFGTKMQEIREDIGRILGANTSCLYVVADSWMYNWYKRRGYVDCTEHGDDNLIWMEKPLNE